MPGVKICLNLISCDEGHVIGRCLENMGHIIDALVVGYNGRFEETPNIIKKFLMDKKIPGAILRTKWVDDFGYSRTEALRYAEEVIDRIRQTNKGKVQMKSGPLTAEEWEESKGEEDTWYFAYTDCDNLMRPDAWKEEDGETKKFFFDKSKLTHDQYAIAMTQSDLRYNYTFLSKYDPQKKRRFEWYEPLHEYISAKVNEKVKGKIVKDKNGITRWDEFQDTSEGSVECVEWQPTIGKLTGGYIKSGREGERSQDPVKYLKDYVVLRRAITKNPNHRNTPRRMLYAAQSIRDYWKAPQIALEEYIARGDLENTWTEERLDAYLNAGRICLRLHPTEPSKALEYFYKGFNVRPTRLECAYEILRIYRFQRLYAAGWNFAKGLVDLPYPPDTLFVDSAVHNWKFLDEAALVAFYCGDKTAYKTLTDRLLQSPHLPEVDKQRIQKGLTYT